MLALPPPWSGRPLAIARWYHSSLRSLSDEAAEFPSSPARVPFPSSLLIIWIQCHLRRSSSSGSSVDFVACTEQHLRRRSLYAPSPRACLRHPLPLVFLVSIAPVILYYSDDLLLLICCNSIALLIFCAYVLLL